MKFFLKTNKPLPITTSLFVITVLSACSNDLIVEYGKGDEVHLVGYADNFDCDDPAYASVKKVRTWTMQFADGSTKFLCAPEGPGKISTPPVPQRSTPLDVSSSTTPYSIGARRNSAR